MTAVRITQRPPQDRIELTVDRVSAVNQERIVVEFEVDLRGYRPGDTVSIEMPSQVRAVAVWRK